jgi:uncharacterized metal-binding protein
MNVPRPKCLFVIPCSGIGKSLGTVGRKAAYKVADELRPQNTRLACLALLTVGDKETVQKIRENPCISIDGCPAKCAQKNIEASNGRLVKSLLVTDILRSHRGLKPEGIIELNPEGCELANIIAEDVAKTVDEIMESTS